MQHYHLHPLPGVRALCPSTIEGAISRGLISVGAALLMSAAAHWWPVTPAAIAIATVLVAAAAISAVAIHRHDAAAGRALLAYSVLGASGAIAAISVGAAQ